MSSRKRFAVTACVALCLAVLLPQNMEAQYPVTLGAGSVASFPPTYKAKSESNGGAGFNATAMLSRKIYADEAPSQNVGGFEAPTKPLPTNDWWTDIINSRFSGALWSYPAMLNTSEAGVTVYWPSYWADAGKEMKSRTNLQVGGKRFRADATIAKDWHDWDVVFRMPSADGEAEMTVTSVHGAPFTWFEFAGIDAELTANVAPELFGVAQGVAGVKIADDLYGLYFPAGSEPMVTNRQITFSQPVEWLVVGLLRTEADLATFARYATSIPRDTRVEWSYDEASAKVNTAWTVTAENLRDAGATAPVLQGILPHAYKYALSGAVLPFVDNTGFVTPRGVMKLAASEGGTFSYSYQFSGMLPSYAAPAEGDGFNTAVLDKLITDYANQGGYGADTYWGGKGLVQMAMNMTFAKQSGNAEVYEKSKTGLRDAFENWLTYSPGEENFFFSYYPRWGAMLGFDVSYDSDAFNDHHFHFGYFTYAAALLCMEDSDFAEKYGEIITLIAKDYANWDRTDTRFPFMRTLDPWCGHSWAGGLGDAGNDNGNGQESTSEAMQSWGGLYLLGVALGNKEMRDAGLWGWNTEARATREYWFDVDAPRPANAGGRKAWAGKGDRQGNYNYDEYPYAYNSNITGKGIGWWTWFGGDPLFMHGIQWMPISPALDYLSWDPDFVSWAFNDMMEGANSSFSHSWFEYTANSDNGEPIEPLAANDWGNVALAYLQRADPAQAAQIFDEAWEKGMHIATSISTSHISYYVTHSHLTYGEPNFDIHADIPTAQVWEKDGVTTYMVYNPSDTDQTVNFYDTTGRLVKSVNAPARKLAAISADPIPVAIDCNIDGGTIIPPGDSASLHARVLDQYGAVMADRTVNYALSVSAPAIVTGNTLKINQNAPRGSRFTLTLSGGELSQEVEITVNDRPTGVNATITGLPEMCERGNRATPVLSVTDQYGVSTIPDDVQWSILLPGEATRSCELPIEFENPGRYEVKGVSPRMNVSVRAIVSVLPPLSNISANATVAASSAENMGSLPAGINDGDTSTRWSSAHQDDQWIVIDLGEDCFVSRVALLWEAAYASQYLIQMAPDGSRMQTLTVAYAGTPTSVTVPVEEAWTAVAEVAQASAGLRETDINATGRYVRLKGVQRATQYGISAYEMSVFGMKLSLAGEAVIGIDFDLPQAMDRGAHIEIFPVGYTADLGTIDNMEVNWSADKPASFVGNTFTPASSGLYTVTATAEGGVSSEKTVFVNDVEEPASITFDRAEYSVIVGDDLVVGYTVNNQFFAPYTGDISSLTVTVTDADGTPSTAATFDVETNIFHSTTVGVYTLRFGELGSCRVAVVELSEINLALGRPVTASSANGNNIGANAVDGTVDTRWESAWEDNQTLDVELAEVYMIDRVRIVWEGAYAAVYSLQVSTDGETWHEFYSQAAGKGNTEEITFAPVPAKYVRLNCVTRALQAYGFSVKEFEVYGQSKLNPDDSVAPTLTEFEVTTSNGAIAAAVSATNPSGAVLLTLTLSDSSGFVAEHSAAVSSGEIWNAEFTELTTGMYSLQLTAADAFGNQTIETKNEIWVTYSIVGINLALGKDAYASSAENAGLAAAYATDGNLDTRWGSQFNDEEWIVVDLGRPYLLTNVKIHWNTPAYATHYSVMLSETGEEDSFQTVHSEEGYSHAGEPVNHIIETEAHSQFVKIVGHRRATGYGTSIDEIEVYGMDDVTAIDAIHALNNGEVRWYNLYGVAIDTPTAPGVYIKVVSGQAEKVTVTGGR